MLTVLNGTERVGFDAVLVAVALMTVGRTGLQQVRDSLRLPAMRSAGFAVILAVGVGIALPCAAYLVERAQWATFRFGKTWPPDFGTHLEWNRLLDSSLLLLFFSAFAEEMVFRGILLPG